mmetsp:Transcript_46356/g.145415  ORF Transcript_46356/g.145415 Transcript_46356/m.145415 type:complete len:88 (-) Transcript_46356:4872-5135(-)
MNFFSFCKFCYSLELNWQRWRVFSLQLLLSTQLLNTSFLQRKDHPPLTWCVVRTSGLSWATDSMLGLSLPSSLIGVRWDDGEWMYRS